MLLGCLFTPRHGVSPSDSFAPGVHTGPALGRATGGPTPREITKCLCA
jgi:hypothetical protein